MLAASGPAAILHTGDGLIAGGTWEKIFKRLKQYKVGRVVFVGFVLFCFAGLGMEPRVLCMIGKCFTNKPHPSPRKAFWMAFEQIDT
jgi:hypothetical protein